MLSFSPIPSCHMAQVIQCDPKSSLKLSQRGDGADLDTISSVAELGGLHRIIRWFKRAWHNTVTVCELIASRVFRYLFDFSTSSKRDEYSPAHNQLNRFGAPSLDPRSDIHKEKLPQFDSIQFRPSQEMMGMCCRVVAHHLQSSSQLLAENPHPRTALSSSAPVLAISAFMDQKLISSPPSVFSIQEAGESLLDWQRIHRRYAVLEEVELSHNLAYLLLSFTQTSAICDRDFVQIAKLLSDFSMRSRDEISQQEREQLNGLKELYEREITAFWQLMSKNDPPFFEKLIKSMRDFNAVSGPALDRIFLTLIQSSLARTLSRVWSFLSKATGDEQKKSVGMSLIFESLNLTTSDQKIDLCTLMLFDSLCISTSAAFTALSFSDLHQLLTRAIALSYRKQRNQLISDLLMRGFDLRVLSQIRSGIPFNDSDFVELTSNDHLTIVKTLTLHYLHRVVRSELIAQFLGAGKYNALLFWQAERLFIDPFLQHQNQLACVVWSIHCLWPFVWIAAGCLPCDLTKRPRQALLSLIQRGLDDLRLRGLALYQKIDASKVNRSEKNPQVGVNDILNSYLHDEIATDLEDHEELFFDAEENLDWMSANDQLKKSADDLNGLCISDPSGFNFEQRFLTARQYSKTLPSHELNSDRLARIYEITPL